MHIFNYLSRSNVNLIWLHLRTVVWNKAWKKRRKEEEKKQRGGWLDDDARKQASDWSFLFLNLSTVVDLNWHQPRCVHHLLIVKELNWSALPQNQKKKCSKQLPLNCYKVCMQVWGDFIFFSPNHIQMSQMCYGNKFLPKLRCSKQPTLVSAVRTVWLVHVLVLVLAQLH